MSKALFVIDVQNYFAVERAIDLPIKIRHHIEDGGYDHVLFSQFINHPDSNFHKILKYTEVGESPAIDLHKDIAELATPETTFVKHTYSFFKAPGVMEYLKEHDVTDIDICGISLDACVLATAYDGFDLGYNIKVLDTLSSVSSVRSDYETSAKTIIGRNLVHRPNRMKRG